MNKQERINEQERIGRNYFKEIALMKGLTESDIYLTGIESNHDAETPKAIIEVKVRTCVSDKFPDYMLEASKLDYMLELAESTKKIPYYFNFFANDEVFVWDMREIKKSIKKETRKFRKNNHESTLVNKDVYMLPKNIAIKGHYLKA